MIFDSVYYLYDFCDALILGGSSNALDKAKAQEIFSAIVIDNKIDYYYIKIDSRMNLCDLLLEKYQNYGELEVFSELKRLVEDLIEISESMKLYDILVRSFVIKSQIALIELDFKLAKQFINRARKIADTKGMNVLAKKISQEHTKLLNTN